MVFCYQNCSDLLWEKIVLVIEKNFWNSRLNFQNFQNFYSSSERSEQFLVTECFFNLLLEVSHIFWIRTIIIQIGKKIGIEKHAGKVRKSSILTKTRFFPSFFCREHEIGRFWYQFSLSLSPSQGLPINHSIAIDTGPNPWIPAQSPYQNYNRRCGLWKSFRGRPKYSLHLCMGWSQWVQTGKSF